MATSPATHMPRKHHLVEAVFAKEQHMTFQTLLVAVEEMCGVAGDEECETAPVNR